MTLYDEQTIKTLEAKANLIRRHVIKMTYAAQSGHPGGSLSYADIIAALFFKVMKHRPDDPKWEGRDKLVLSKGHAAPAYYAALAEAGYFPVKDLTSLRQLGSHLQGHPCRRKTPGIEISTGSLGQGLSVANGMGLAAKLDRRATRIYCLCGDGEMQEGQNWEAAMLASHYKIDNVTAIIDRNRMQIDGPTEQIMSLEPLGDKWRAFGWNVIEINGHDMRQILEACDKAKQVTGKPTVIIANTIKGKGVSFMEGAVAFHGKAPNQDEYRIALKELGEPQ
ncbi:transketolase [Methanomassiliicoccus luminyensis]|uniref:transketolase n=1 Tax=Methanomassiliicoccus luminyensis TaxID=1080712 RepID=UPI0003616E12|nr:transketolase [Methanomassiliicoccus luminyensis]